MNNQSAVYREIDEGKKEAVDVKIITKDYIIEGTAFKSAGHRFSDYLNSTSEDFISLKDVKVYSLENEELLQSLSYLGVNKTHIVMITEL